MSTVMAGALLFENETMFAIVGEDADNETIIAILVHSGDCRHLALLPPLRRGC